MYLVVPKDVPTFLELLYLLLICYVDRLEDLQFSEAQQDYLAHVASVYIQDYKT